MGASAPPLFVPGKKVPFFGNESALFPWNGSAVLAKLKCPFSSVPPYFRGASAASATVLVVAKIFRVRDYLNWIRLPTDPS